MIEILQDAVIDTIKLIPFLFITYLIMEYIENKTSGKIREKIKKSGRFGPLIGGVVGVLPQCGFSASATNLYSSRLISIGTLIAVYLSTSDEMIPIFISEAMPIELIVKILGIKLFLGVFWGFLIDFLYKKFIKRKDQKEYNMDTEICEEEHCHCHEQGILKASLIHTRNITIYIFAITLIINGIIGIIGEENIEIFIKNDLENIVLSYKDNGPGLADIFENPYEIFNYGTTSKIDKEGNPIGTGMGMYIVSSTLREYDATPIIIEYKKGLELQMKIRR